MAHAASSDHHHHHHHNGTPIPPNGYPPPPDADDNPPSYPSYPPDLALSSSLLEPRIAVVLNVPKPWRPWLFACRLLSIFPAIFWALQPALTLLVQIIPVAVPGGKKAVDAAAASGVGVGVGVGGFAGSTCPPPNWPPGHPEIPFPWTEMTHVGMDYACRPDDGGGLYRVAVIAKMRGFCVPFLLFHRLPDVAMSSQNLVVFAPPLEQTVLTLARLINYTPQATIIRLLTINATNAFLTERILTFSGGFEDPRLLLPGWVTIATTLTIAYHITQRSINIQKETSTSINIFSIASFISMISLLAHLHYNGSDYPEKPFESLARLMLDQARRLPGEAILPSYPPSHSEL
ncbi:LOW QUALITY PROTEIN: hypothetical protein CH63R_09906 [Colletotrichum higginsianum IMI 349063]|uniref:N-glycosylation protein eos1 n=1 Tax=Colletotrichum higginsianum (strain IMI 349063) TaxID=759273 RepID=A0A1B7Y191_COLHI|nr:LOW QUALITY PROTEIN: uncharacterized protein CH63R_09906 [Colletotrichum higginsianum IMI 349063]OBR05786.1 LOW QUALITY PROTEIN: hypothetical protein CH63R_09906 [Colletotrichum higginsianum IMI 349063]